MQNSTSALTAVATSFASYTQPPSLPCLQAQAGWGGQCAEQHLCPYCSGYLNGGAARNVSDGTAHGNGEEGNRYRTGKKQGIAEEGKGKWRGRAGRDMCSQHR